MRKVLIYIFCLFLVSGFLSCTKNIGVGLNPGDKAPEISLKDFNGKEISLEVYKGKTILLNFWASWCQPCIEEAPELEQLYRNLKDKDFVIIGIAVDDDEEAVKEFIKKYSITYPILNDSKSKISRKYKTKGYPESFVIDKQGKLKVFRNPLNGYPETRIVGPREWNSKSFILEILS